MSRMDRYKNGSDPEAVVKEKAGKEKPDRERKESSEVTLFGKLLGFIGTAIMVVSIIVCLVLAAPRIAGINSYIVISGSMEPAIPVGSLVYSKSCDPEELKPDDIIVFFETTGGDTPVTHRVVENKVADEELITKGDANEQADIHPVIYPNVQGKVLLHVPKLGYIASPLSSITGKIAVGMVILAGYLLAEAGSRFRKRKK